MTGEHDVFSNTELAILFKGLGAYDRLFLAVSGGADSIALMQLVARWHRQTGQRSHLYVLTVDHGLRAAARAEAEAVVVAATELGIPSRILTWRGPRPETAVQATARELRYGLLFAHIAEQETEDAENQGSAALITAHHKDDLAETVLMRLARGAGVDGLAAIPPVSSRDGIALLRPLLDVPKQRLAAQLRADGIAWHEDPSNANSNFERVRVRAASAARTELNLGDGALALTARRMARAKAALDEIADRELLPHLESRLLTRTGVFAWGWSRGDMPDEIAIRMLMRLLPGISGQSPSVRLLRVESLWQQMCDPSFAGATLAGCIVTPAHSPERTILIYREPKRHKLATLRLSPSPEQSRAVVWDNRFEITFPPLPAGQWQIRAFNHRDLMVFDYDTNAVPLPCPIGALEATPVLEGPDGPIWIPALDVHRFGGCTLSRSALSCRFRGIYALGNRSVKIK